MTQDEFYSKLMQDVEYIFKTGFKLSPEMFMQTMSYASEQYELLSKRIAELEHTISIVDIIKINTEAPRSCDSCKFQSIYEGTFTCSTLDNAVYTPPQEPYGIYIEDAHKFSCINYTPKDSND
jgi:hypothetical protein